MIDDNLRSDVDELDKGIVVLVVVEGLVSLLIVADTIHEIAGCNLWVFPKVVRRCGFDLADVIHDQLAIVTNRFDEERLDPLGKTGLVDPFTAGLGRISSVKDCDLALGFMEPANHIGHSCFGRGKTKAFAIRVRCVEESGVRARRVNPAVLTDIEDPGGNSDPGKVTEG